MQNLRNQPAKHGFHLDAILDSPISISNPAMEHPLSEPLLGAVREKTTFICPTSLASIAPTKKTVTDGKRNPFLGKPKQLP